MHLKCLFSPKSLVWLVVSGAMLLISPHVMSQEDGANQLPFRASLGASFKVMQNIPDLRYAREEVKDIFGERVSVPQERYAIFSQDFHMEVLMSNSDSYSSALKVGLGFRNDLGASESGPEGSEFSGYRIALRQNLLNGYLQNTLQYGHRRSDLFKLHARHSEFLIDLFYVPVPEAKDPSKFPFYLKIGGDLLLASTTNPDRADSYGPTWGAIIFLRRHWNLSDQLPVALSLNSQYHRISSYKVLGSTEASAGLLSVSPQFDIMVVENLWFGVQWNVAVLRPIDREEAFPNPDLTGLYGNGFSVQLKTSTF